MTKEEMQKLILSDAPIRALSWKQPYAELMLHGKIETRTWQTNYRGMVLICASKSPYHDETVRVISGTHYEKIIRIVLINKIIHGHAFAIGSLTDCRKMQPEDENKCFAKYYPDLYCHVYENVFPINPFPWKGKQGWSVLSEGDKMKIQLL